MLQPIEDFCIVNLENIYPVVTNVFIPEPKKLFAQKVWKGKVIYAGKGYLHEVKHNGISTGKVKRIPMTIKAGDVVLIPAHASNLFKVFDDKTVIVRERDIYCYIEGDDTEISLPRQAMYRPAEEKGVLPEPC